MTTALYRDPQKRKQIYRLIDQTWPGGYQVIRLAEKYGVPWHQASTPFVRCSGEQVIAHVGVLDIPFRIAQKKVHVAGLHAVCTHPDYRGRGYNRQVMEEALRYCDGQYDTVILCANDSAIYARYGFRTVTQHYFTTDRVPKDKKDTSSFRTLSVSSMDDLVLLTRLLQHRAPVSNILGVLETGCIFITNELFNHHHLKRLHYAEDLDCIIAFEIEECSLRLLDVVGSSIPSLEMIASRIHADFDRIEIHFTPDLLDVPAVQITRYDVPNDDFMVRGPFAIEHQPFIIPPLARC